MVPIQQLKGRYCQTEFLKSNVQLYTVRRNFKYKETKKLKVRG